MGSRSLSVNWAESNEPCSSSLGCRVSNSGGAFTLASTKAKLATPSQEPSSSAAWEIIRDRSFEQQRYRASGLTLVTAAIALWNTVYIERAIGASTRSGFAIDPELFKFLSPLGWEHINLTGDYQWRGHRLAQGRFRPLRIPSQP
jgi:hypothetical protein